MKDIVLVLPDMRSCHNVGAMFRTADICGVSKLYLVGYTAQPPKPQIDKVALGAEMWVPFEHAETIDPVIVSLKKEGYSIVSLEKTDDSVSLYDFDVPDKIAIVVGNEVKGVDEATVLATDHVVHIPMYGKKESMNVSIAAGIMMYACKKVHEQGM